MNLESKIYIAGHQGMVGSAIWRNLESKGYNNLIGKTISELDLMNQQVVTEFFKQEKPEYVFLAAAKVGGIVANNTYRAQFIYENLMIQNNIIHSSYEFDVKKLLFLGSSCIYPKNAKQPLKEEYLLSGQLEYTNEPYAIAKIAGIKMCENYYKQYGCNFISVMPTNLYGPNDNYNLETSHVLPALIRKLHLGKCIENNDWEAIRKDLNKRPINGIDGNSSENEIIDCLNYFGIQYSKIINSLEQIKKSENINPKYVTISLWGTGKVYREFLHVDDIADACIHVLENVDAPKLYKEMKQTHINIGTGEDLSIEELAELIKAVIGFKGELIWDNSKPDGTQKKQLNVDLLNKLNWNYKIELQKGIQEVYQNYIH